MALTLADRVRETTSVVGTGPATLTGAVAGFRTFSSVLSNSDTTYYAIVSLTGSLWEVGVGTYSANVLTRTTVLDSTNSNALVDFPAGTKYVFITQPAGRAVYSNGTNVASADGATVPNSLLANSSITINGTSVSLGGSTTITAAAPYALTIGTGLSGTSYNGSAAVTIAVSTISTANGGTGLTSYTAGDLLYYTSGTVLSKLGIGTAGYFLSSTGSAPQWTQTLAIANGGTGQTTASAAFNALSPITTTGDLIIGSGVNTATRLAIGASSYVLTSNGTTATWSAAGTSVSTISFGTTGLTPATATSGAVTVAGTLALANGGTGATTVSGAQTNLQVDPAGTAVAMAIALG